MFRAFYIDLEEVNPSDPVLSAVVVNRRARNLDLADRRLAKKESERR